MMSRAKWISSIALGLLACHGWNADAQQASAPGEPRTARALGARDFEFGDPRYGQDAADTDGAEPAAVDTSTKADSDTTTADADDKAANGEPELIKERYSNGEVKIEREVTQDAGSNYLNHGSWKMWNEKGGEVAEGQYNYGQRVGTWVRWYRSANEAHLLTRSPYTEFTPPYISQATFENDQLNGDWTIYDGKKRKISQWQFVDGKRHGTSTWWHVNGRKMREIYFRNGDIDGQLIEWNPEGAVTLKEIYQSGRKLAEKTSKYPDGTKKSQGMYLFAKDVEKTPDDWWNCKLVSTTKSGNDEKHGAVDQLALQRQTSTRRRLRARHAGRPVHLVALQRSEVAGRPIRRRQAGRTVDLVVCQRPEVDPGHLQPRKSHRPLDLVERGRQGGPIGRPVAHRRRRDPTVAGPHAQHAAAGPPAGKPADDATLATDLVSNPQF